MRDGFCRTNQWDQGRHLVCARLTDEFLQFTRSRGNDLMTPAPQYQFPGLKPGVCHFNSFAHSATSFNSVLHHYEAESDACLHWQDKWCLCVLRWKEALEAGVAPPVELTATHEAALRFVTLEQLQEHALPSDDGPCCDGCADKSTNTPSTDSSSQHSEL